LINFKNNITVNFEMSYLLNTSENVSKIEIYGEKGSIIWPKGEIFLINKNGFFKKSKIKLDNNFKASETQINSFVNHVRGKGKLLVKLSESEYIVDLIDYLYKSAKNKKEINYEKK
jgi:predicted dehydrogenase